MIGARKVRDLAPLSTGLVSRRALEETPLATRSGQACRKFLGDDSVYGDLQRQHMDVFTSVRWSHIFDRLGTVQGRRWLGFEGTDALSKGSPEGPPVPH
jgi:hypothetical protein